MKNKYYLLNFPRPVGVEPTIYVHKPVFQPEAVEVEEGHFLTDPYTDPEVLEFNSVKEAIEHIVSFNGTDEYLANIKFSTYRGDHPENDDHFKDMQDFLVNLP